MRHGRGARQREASAREGKVGDNGVISELRVAGRLVAVKVEEALGQSMVGREVSVSKPEEMERGERGKTS